MFIAGGESTLKRFLTSFISSAMIVFIITGTAFAQGDAIENPETATPPGDFTLSGGAAIVTQPAMTGGDYTASLYDTSGIGAQADPDAFWRLGMTQLGLTPLAESVGHLIEPSAAFRTDRDTSDMYFLFPATGISRTVEAAYYNLLQRTGSYAADAEMTLEVVDAHGVPQRVVSATEVDLQSAPLNVWTPVERSVHPDDWGVYPGERLAFHAHLSDGPGGDLDVRPIFEVQLSSGSGPEPTPSADVAISKSVSSSRAIPGETITYTLTYTNYGPATAGGVQIQDIVPVTLTNVSAVHSGAQITPTGSITFTWDVEDLVRYAGGIITIAGQVDPALARTEYVTNTALISTTTYEQVTSDNQSSASFEAFVDPILSIEKWADPDIDVPYHGAVTYTLALRNTGPVSATNTVVTDALPSLVEFARWITSPQESTLEDDVILWNGTITPGQVVTWSFAVTHTGDFDDVITNTARYSHTAGVGSAAASFKVIGPELSIAKTVSPHSDAPYRGEVTYTITVSNTGQVEALDTHLADVLPEEVEFARWITYPQGYTPEAGDIHWTGSITTGVALTWTFVATQTADYAQTVTNTARYTQTYGSGRAGAAFTVAEPLLSIDKSVSPDLLVNYHSEVTYTLALHNAGAASAPGTLLTDTVPGKATFARWDEQNGATISGTQLTWAGTVSASQSVTVSFVATHTGDYGDVVPNGAMFLQPLSGQSGSDVASFSVVTAPVLTGTKTVEPQYGVARHGEVTYTLTVSNTGEAVAAGTILTDAVPIGTHFARWLEQPSGAELAGDQILWTGDIASGSDIRVRFAATHTGSYGDVISNTLEYRLPSSGQAGYASAQFSVEKPPLLRLEAEVEPTYIRCGDVVTYSIALRNDGDEDSLPTALTDTLPTGVTFAHWLEQPAGTTPSGNEILWSGTLSAHQSIQWGFVATHTGPCEGSYTNTVRYDNASSSRDAIAVFAVAAPELEITKQVEPVSGVSRYGVVTYTIMLSNTGPFDALNVLMTDALPSEVEFGHWIDEASSGTIQNGNTITWTGRARTDRPLAWHFTVTHTGDYGDVVTNTARYDSGDGSGSGTAVFSVLGPPEMQLAKRAAPTAILEGGEITYTVALSNSGPSPTVDAWLTDTLPSHTAWVRWVEQPTSTVQGSVALTWTGTVVPGETITWAYVLSHTGAVGDVLTNTVVCGNTSGGAEAEARVVVFGPVYLPAVFKRMCAPDPDLTVVNIEGGTNQIRVAIENRGTRTIADDPANEFWVDLYVRPETTPTHVNQPWATLGDHGAAWGITWSGDPYSPSDPSRQALPLKPGEVFTLTTGGDYYWPTQSSVPWPLAAGTPLYAQVDSVRFGSWYGVIAEQDELCHTQYNNIHGPVPVSDGVPGEADISAAAGEKNIRLTGLPRR